MYQARITRLDNVRKHPNADKLQLADCVGNQVVVGLSYTEGEVGIYFPTDGQLSHEMCVENNLYNKSACQQLALADPQAYGFFDANRRVRAQGFRGQKSDGIWLPLESLQWYLGPGISLDEGSLIDDPRVCNKYETEATKRAKNRPQRATKRGETVMFKKHQDTEQFRYGWPDVPDGSLLTMTEKLHGTSGRYGHVLDTAVLASWKQAINTMLAKVKMGPVFHPPARWTHLMGSRNVIIEHSGGQGYYGSDEFRYQAVGGIQLRKGETIYFELVGDVATGQPIMPPAHVDARELPLVHQRYGKSFQWRYGTSSGQCRLYVYRITQGNEDGDVVELSWPQVKKRCYDLGILHVPEIVTGSVIVDEGSDRKRLAVLVESLSQGTSELDSTHLREGVVVRVDTPQGRTYWLKEKSYAFKVLEGIIKLDADYVDIEESA